MYTLVLVRHGESEWNRQKLFTGWTDVGLTPEGVEDARALGKTLKEAGFSFPVAFTSYLKRAYLTLDLILEEMGTQSLTTVVRDWHLNERHYGKLQGKSKIDILEELDWSQVHSYRRAYTTRPPLLEVDDPRNPARDPKYADIPEESLPRGESLADAYDRIIPYVREVVISQLPESKSVLVSGHGNVLRVLMKYFEDLTDNEIEGVEFAIGEILIYSLDEQFQIVSKRTILAEKNPLYGSDM